MRINLSSGLIEAGFCGSMDTLKLEEYVGKVDLLTGGVPCQSFSQAGLRKGLEDPRGELMIKFGDMIKILQPKTFMIENVRGLLTHNKGETIREIIKILNKEELYTIEYKLLNSFDYGVPQKRERVFIIGILKTEHLTFSFPEKDPNPILLKNVLYDVPESQGAKYSDEKKRLFALIPQGGCWIDLPIDTQKEYLVFIRWWKAWNFVSSFDGY